MIVKKHKQVVHATRELMLGKAERYYQSIQLLRRRLLLAILLDKPREALAYATALEAMGQEGVIQDTQKRAEQLAKVGKEVARV
jgi:hypothetical protein